VSAMSHKPESATFDHTHSKSPARRKEDSPRLIQLVNSRIASMTQFACVLQFRRELLELSIDAMTSNN
jgi:hypothetical protein